MLVILPLLLTAGSQVVIGDGGGGGGEGVGRDVLDPGFTPADSLSSCGCNCALAADGSMTATASAAPPPASDSPAENQEPGLGFPLPPSMYGDIPDGPSPCVCKLRCTACVLNGSCTSCIHPPGGYCVNQCITQCRLYICHGPLYKGEAPALE